MYLRAGVLSLGLLILSRVLGLLRESAQAAAFGSTGLGDAVIVMFTLPDLLVGVLFSGALSYVLLPLWATQDAGQVQRSQKKVASLLVLSGLLLGLAIWLCRRVLSQALAPGLQGALQALSANSLIWSAAVLPLAMLAALWVTRLQHERDFVGMYAGNLLVNVVLVGALFFAARTGAEPAVPTITLLGCFLVVAMLARLAWLRWRVPVTLCPVNSKTAAGLPKASIWAWAALSSGLLLLLPLIGRSLASQAGEGALAVFNYAWKLVELPLVLAIQLVASVAFPAITRTQEGSTERLKALQVSFALAWALACAAISVVATFSGPLARLLFGWGRMGPEGLALIAQWSAAGIWSLLPQALIAVVLTVMAISQQMHVAVWTYAAGIAALLLVGWSGALAINGVGPADGAAVMWALNAVLATVALILLLHQRSKLRGALSATGLLAPLAVCMVLVACRPSLASLNIWATAGLAALFSVMVTGAAVLATPPLRSMAQTLVKRVTRRKAIQR